MRHIGDPQRLREQLRDAVPTAFAEARGDIERWKRAIDTLIDSAAEEIESLRRFGLGSSEVQAVARTFAQDQHLRASGRRLERTGPVQQLLLRVAADRGRATAHRRPSLGPLPAPPMPRRSPSTPR
jgi:regulator of sirC expression with transglutaminase-like and TPR domain